jgi:hypothetical protein
MVTCTKSEGTKSKANCCRWVECGGDPLGFEGCVGVVGVGGWEWCGCGAGRFVKMVGEFGSQRGLCLKSLFQFSGKLKELAANVIAHAKLPVVPSNPFASVSCKR